MCGLSVTTRACVCGCGRVHAAAQVSILPLYKFPRWQDASAGGFAASDNHTLRFTVPQSLGALRDVRVAVRPVAAGGAALGPTVASNPLTFNFTGPRVQFVALLPLDSTVLGPLAADTPPHHVMLEVRGVVGGLAAGVLVCVCGRGVGGSALPRSVCAFAKRACARFLCAEVLAHVCVRTCVCANCACNESPPCAHACTPPRERGWFLRCAAVCVCFHKLPPPPLPRSTAATLVRGSW
jgi:hypothetical protein